MRFSTIVTILTMGSVMMRNPIAAPRNAVASNVDV